MSIDEVMKVANDFGVSPLLRHVIELHVKAEMAWRDAEIERLLKTLNEIATYWNGSHRPAETLDAAEWTRGVAEEALAATEAKP